MNVIEIFSSIQGEGKYIGKPTVFIRLAGCNLRCVWCDTKYALTGGTDISVPEIIRLVNQQGIGTVCITGGEPMLQIDELKKLVKGLKDVGYRIVLETNGTLYDEWVFENVDCVSLDMKPPSSGMKSSEGILKKLVEKDQVKVVISDDRDYEYAKEILKKTSVEVIIQPLGGTRLEEIAGKVVAEKIDVRVLPQLHKIIDVK
ncbi:MAG: 7-carboxy-7-deazaguanine synthase QueE [Candidatus Altiarchaeota archaeon]